MSIAYIKNRWKPNYFLVKNLFIELKCQMRRWARLRPSVPKRICCQSNMRELQKSFWFKRWIYLNTHSSQKILLNILVLAKNRSLTNIDNELSKVKKVATRLFFISNSFSHLHSVLYRYPWIINCFLQFHVKEYLIFSHASPFAFNIAIYTDFSCSAFQNK